MKITAIYRHYWPDTTPYARILRSILESALELDHEARVWTGQPCYNDVEVAPQPRDENLHGVQVHRFQLPRAQKSDPVWRVGSLGAFLAKAWQATLAESRPDLLLVNCTSPVAVGLLVRTLCRFGGVPCISTTPKTSILRRCGRLSGSSRAMVRVGGAESESIHLGMRI